MGKVKRERERVKEVMRGVTGRIVLIAAIADSPTVNSTVRRHFRRVDWLCWTLRLRGGGRNGSFGSRFARPRKLQRQRRLNGKPHLITEIWLWLHSPTRHRDAGAGWLQERTNQSADSCSTTMHHVVRRKVTSAWAGGKKAIGELVWWSKHD